VGGRADRVEPITELDVVPRAALHDVESALAEPVQGDGFPVPDMPVTSTFGKTARYPPLVRPMVVPCRWPHPRTMPK
jgi:hypothetical protein